MDLQITKDETYSGTNIEEKDSPETLKLNKDQQVQNQAKIKEVNDGRGDTMNNNNRNRGEVEHDESNYTSYDEQVNIRSPGT